MKQRLIDNAIDADDPGPDTLSGAGLVQVPSFVSAPLGSCGNGVLDAGESCDDGNTTNGDCCSSTCASLATTGSICRATQGVCDAAETCDGISAACPVDLKSSGTCRPSTGTCDPEEICDGFSDACPADELFPAGTVCRAGAGACDPEEACDGSTTACPADVGQPDGDGDGACDEADLCPQDADAGQEDTDGDGLGDACDACNAGPSVENAILKLSKYATGPGDDRFKLTGILSFASAPAFDPVATGIRIVVHDADRNRVLDTHVPGGAYDKATPTGSRSVFRSAGLVGGFVNRVRIQTTAAGADVYKVVVTGSRGGFAAIPPVLPLRAAIALTPPVASAGICGEAVFDPDDCEMGTTGNTARCR
ncbi:MAG: hypothetical protein P8R42_29560 [Candidatus Binatia bacterium]|nr:hypothetical protein [Candidatus Binatia bacterium]